MTVASYHRFYRLRRIGALVALVGASASAALAITSVPAFSDSPDAIELKSGMSSYSIHEAQVIVDPTRTLEIEQVLGLEAKGMANWSMMTNLNFGFSNNRYWLKVPVANLTSSNIDWVLESAYPMIQDIRFYQVTRGKRVAEQRMGRLQPFGARPVDHWSFVFDISVPKGTQSDLYVMFQSVGHIDAAMSIYTHDAFLSRSIRKAVGMGLYCGIILAMVLYNFFLFISIRDRSYLFYIIYALTLCLLQCTLNGTTYQFLWPNWVAWNNISAPVFAGVGYLFLGLFTKSLLDTKRLVPKLDVLINVTIAASILLVVWSVFFYGVNTNRFTSMLQIGVPVILLPISVTCAWMGSLAAVYYSIAFGCFFLGSGILASGFLGLVPRSFLTVNSMYFGSAAETILFSLALAARIKIMKDAKLTSDIQTAEVARQLSESQTKLEQQQAVSALASQVAHDIRSPLAALEVAAGDVSQLSENKRILIRSAVGRIRDIANSLLDRQHVKIARPTTHDGAADSVSVQEAISPQLLSSLIESLVTEKRLQFRSRSHVEIEAWLDASSYGIFAQVQPVEFKRLLSNIIDNSVDAFANSPGAVSVNLSARDGRALVGVHDNGKGIPPDLLAKLGRRGETHGKEGGTGLGLYHARTSAESWGGSLEIVSEVGQGTTITVNLPQALTPDWFVSELTPVPGRSFLILDDDESIHQVWQGRLDVLKARERFIEIVHVSTPGEIRKWVKGNAQNAHEALYLLDYELLDYKETGLSLAEELGIGEQAILVTSRFEEPEILENCRRLKIRMIPKGLAGLVPIRVASPATAEAPASESWNAILIDDDPLVRMTWQVAAELAHKRLKVFASTEEFFPEAETLGRGTPIYIDATLGNGSRGEDESRRIHSMGFSEIYLATGQKAEEFSAYVHLRGVVGKSPPWKS